MWWNIIPAFAVVFSGVAAPGFGLYWLHYLVLGNHYRRTLLERWDRINYQRDARLTGDAYKVLGLESIPDEPEKKK